MFKTTVLSLISLLAVGALYGDSVTLKNGDIYSGRQLSEEKGIIRFETTEGVVNLKKADIEKTVKNESVVDLYYQKKTGVKTAAQHYELARWCFANSFKRAGIAERNEALRLAPEIEKNTKDKISPACYEKPRMYSPFKLLAGLRRSWDNKEKAPEYKKNLKNCDPAALKRALAKQLDYRSEKNAAFRGFVLDEIQKAGPLNLEDLSDHLKKEPEKELRKKTFDIINAHYLSKDADTKTEFETDMMKSVISGRSLEERKYASESLAYMRSHRGVWSILKRIKIIWIGSGNRAHISVGTVHSYIRDVTPVVATGATSFDPEISTYNTASALEVRIRHVEAEILIKRLETMTGRTFNSPMEWFYWWNDEGHKGI